MPKPLNVDWPAVRVLAVAVGVREAARQMQKYSGTSNPNSRYGGRSWVGLFVDATRTRMSAISGNGSKKELILLSFDS
jgi:hypothetical protein